MLRDLVADGDRGEGIRVRRRRADRGDARSRASGAIRPGGPRGAAATTLSRLFPCLDDEQ